MAIICHDYKLLFIQVPATGCSSISKVLMEQFGGEKLPKSDILLGGKYKRVGIKHNSVNQLIGFNLITKDEYRTYLKLATIRNPFDYFATTYERLIGSWWEKMIYTDKPHAPVNRSGEVNRDRYIKKFTHEIKLAREEGFERWLARKILLPQRLDKRIEDWVKSSFKKRALLWSKTALKMDIAYPLTTNVDKVIRYEHLEQDFNKILKEAGVASHISVPHINPTPGKQSYHQYYTPKARQILEQELANELAVFDYSFN